MTGIDLRQSPFYVLGVSPRANRAALSEAFETALDSPESNEATLTKAHQALMAPKPRLQAEVSWLIGVAPNRARALLDREVAPSAGELAALPPLAGANLAAHWCSQGTPNSSVLEFLVQHQAAIDSTVVTSLINSERRVSTFGSVEQAFVADTLGWLRLRHLDAADHALRNLKDPGDECLRLLHDYHETDDAVTAFVDELVERFDAWANPDLRRLRDALFDLLSAISEESSLLRERSAEFKTTLTSWQRLVGPMQFVAAQRGLVDPRTKEIFDRIRSTVLTLNNDMNEPGHALALVNLVREFFSSVPDLGDRLHSDLEKLEELVEEKELEELLGPLASVLESAKEHHVDLAPSVRRGQFRSDGSGLAGTLYRAFDRTARACAPTDFADRPFLGIRSLAIDLHNDSSATEEALALVQALREYSGAPVPAGVQTLLHQDERTLRRVSLQKELTLAAGQKDFNRVIALTKTLESVTDDSEELTTLREVAARASRQRQGKYLQWAFYGGIAALIFWGALSEDRNTSPRSTTPAPLSSRTASPFDDTIASASAEEIRPPISQGRILSVAELRYCLFENERLQIISGILGDRATDVIVDRFNASVEDFNSRCAENRYRDSDDTTIRRQLTASRPQLEAESRGRIATWSAGLRQ